MKSIQHLYSFSRFSDEVQYHIKYAYCYKHLGLLKSERFLFLYLQLEAKVLPYRFLSFWRYIQEESFFLLYCFISLFPSSQPQGQKDNSVTELGFSGLVLFCFVFFPRCHPKYFMHWAIVRTVLVSFRTCKKKFR